jgi:hypothetical protein
MRITVLLASSIVDIPCMRLRAISMLAKTATLPMSWALRRQMRNLCTDIRAQTSVHSQAQFLSIYVAPLAEVCMCDAPGLVHDVPFHTCQRRQLRQG